MADKILFIVFGALAVVGGLGTITRKNIIHALLLLVFTFLNVAAIFFLTQAYFVAMIQILVYAGAIMVLFVFVIMFLNLRTYHIEEQTHRRQRWIALGLSVLVLAEFVIVLAGITFTSARGGFSPAEVTAAGGNSQAFGVALFNNMLLPFEVASVILLVAMVGAIILVKKEKDAQLATRQWEPGAEAGAGADGEAGAGSGAGQGAETGAETGVDVVEEEV
jgi:NADH-quinone oxidoreductase subunit J